MLSSFSFCDFCAFLWLNSFSAFSWLWPTLSVTTQAFIRIAYGILMLGTLLWALPQWRRFFVSERWGGYAESSREIDFIQNPAGTVVIALLWFASVVLLILGYWTTIAAL